MVGRLGMKCGFLGGALLLSAVGCAGTETVPAQQSLYDRLGGKPAISAVIDQFVANVGGDSRINGRFATTDIPRLKGNLVDQVCMATGGPCEYKGRDMKTTHAGMKISNADFRGVGRGFDQGARYLQSTGSRKGRIARASWSNEKRYR